MTNEQRNVTVPSSELLEFKETPELARTAKILTPTEQICHELQGGYSFFNEALFGGELPECVLTMDTSVQFAYGYFRPNGFVSGDGTAKHEISLNAKHIKNRPVEKVLSTLVHEQCHLWIYDIGGRKTVNAYHCKKWAAQMLEVGLHPTNDGTFSGAQTGYRVSHLIINDGPFDRACRSLIESGFNLTWGRALQALGSVKRKSDAIKGKATFVCPKCKAVAWAAPSRRLICGEDHVRMEKQSK